MSPICKQTALIKADRVVQYATSISLTHTLTQLTVRCWKMSREAGMAHITHTSCVTSWHWPFYDFSVEVCKYKTCLCLDFALEHSHSFPFLSIPFSHLFASMFFSCFDPSLDFCFRLLRRRLS